MQVGSVFSYFNKMKKTNSKCQISSKKYLIVSLSVENLQWLKYQFSHLLLLWLFIYLTIYLFCICRFFLALSNSFSVFLCVVRS